MAEIAKRDVVFEGVRSLVRESGRVGAREAVVFVHGNPGSGEDWVDLLSRVGEFARAIAPDMPGYGKADRPETFNFTVGGYAAHLGGLLDQLGVERAHLVLHDFGGPWGLSLAAQRPRTVASVTLVNTGILPGYRWHKYARVWRTPLLGELFMLTATRRALGMMLNADNPKPLPSVFIERMYGDMDRGMKRAVLALYRATSDLDGQSRLLGGHLMPLKVPALVLWGKGDAYLPYRYAEVQRQYFDVSAVHLLDGCGHWPFIDEPEAAASFIVPFLRKQVEVESVRGVAAQTVA
jgi:pimeloyl-ACP methyl ester carboxylesterase